MGQQTLVLLFFDSNVFRKISWGCHFNASRYTCIQTHKHAYSSSFLVSLAVQSNSEVPQGSVLVPFKICMCEIKKSRNVNRPLTARSVFDGEAGECWECKKTVPAFPSSRGAVGGETLRLEVGKEGGSSVAAMGGLACCTPYLEECRTLKTSDDAHPQKH